MKNDMMSGGMTKDMECFRTCVSESAMGAMGGMANMGDMANMSSMGDMANMKGMDEAAMKKMADDMMNTMKDDMMKGLDATTMGVNMKRRL